MYAGKSMLMDDETADALLEYAGLLPAARAGDTVTVKAVSPDGNEVEMTLLLNASTELVSESTHSQLGPPTNELVVAYLRERIAAMRNPPSAKTQTREAAIASRGDEYGDFL